MIGGRRGRLGPGLALAALGITVAFLGKACTYKNPEQQENKKNQEALTVYFLTATLNPQCPTTVTTVNYSNLAAAGTTANCAKSGCHVGSGAPNGFDITSYQSTRSRISPRDIGASLLYQKITTGSMVANTTPQTTEAILNWICSGGNP